MVSLESDVRWRVGGLVDRQILSEQGIKSNGEYRKYLCENADQIIGLNQASACAEVCPICTWCSGEKTDAPPYLYKSPLGTAQPPGYETSNLKEQYLGSYRAKSAKARIRVDAESVSLLKDFFITGN